MKRSERYYQESRRQMFWGALLIATATSISCWVEVMPQSLKLISVLLFFPLLALVSFTIGNALQTRRLAKQSEQAEINRAIRPRL